MSGERYSTHNPKVVGWKPATADIITDFENNAVGILRRFQHFIKIYL